MTGNGRDNERTKREEGPRYGGGVRSGNGGWGTADWRMGNGFRNITSHAGSQHKGNRTEQNRDEFRFGVRFG